MTEQEITKYFRYLENEMILLERIRENQAAMIRRDMETKQRYYSALERIANSTVSQFASVDQIPNELKRIAIEALEKNHD